MANKIKIPKEFDLAGTTIKVSDDPDLCRKENALGKAYFVEDEIVLQTVSRAFPHGKRELVFCHELVHTILHHADEEDLSYNETFVSRISQLLHHALKSFRY